MDGFFAGHNKIICLSSNGYFSHFRNLSRSLYKFNRWIVFTNRYKTSCIFIIKVTIIFFRSCKLPIWNLCFLNWIIIFHIQWVLSCLMLWFFIFYVSIRDSWYRNLFILTLFLFLKHIMTIINLSLSLWLLLIIFVWVILLVPWWFLTFNANWLKKRLCWIVIKCSLLILLFYWISPYWWFKLMLHFAHTNKIWVRIYSLLFQILCQRDSIEHFMGIFSFYWNELFVFILLNCFEWFFMLFEKPIRINGLLFILLFHHLRIFSINISLDPLAISCILSLMLI